MKYYPTYMPLPLVDYSFANDNRTITTSFESGRVSQRSQATKQRDIITVVFQFNYFQLGVWEGFVQSVLNNGANEFTISLPESVNQANTETIVLLSGGKYKTTSVAGDRLWKVSCDLIKQDKETMSENDFDLLAYIDGDYETFILTSDRFHTYVNETLPEIT